MAEINPDFLVAGLRAEIAEVERLPDSASKAAQIAAVKAELERADRLERPAATAEEPDRTVPDTRHWYLDALHAEKASSHESRHAEIDVEIARVTAELNRPVVAENDSAEATADAPTPRGRRATTPKE